MVCWREPKAFVQLWKTGSRIRQALPRAPVQRMISQFSNRRLTSRGRPLKIHCGLFSFVGVNQASLSITRSRNSPESRQVSTPHSQSVHVPKVDSATSWLSSTTLVPVFPGFICSTLGLLFGFFFRCLPRQIHSTSYWSVFNVAAEVKLLVNSVAPLLHHCTRPATKGRLCSSSLLVTKHIPCMLHQWCDKGKVQ